MQLIGLTGGIATGKSTASAYLRWNGIPVIDADLLAKRALEPGTSAYKKVCQLFSTAVVGGVLDRGKLGEIIFNDRDSRRTLERIVHPVVQISIVKAIVWYWLLGYDRIVLDIPLLFETKLNKWMSYTVVITATEEIQEDRLVKRNIMTPEQAKSRISSQMPSREKCKLADVVIYNEGEMSALYEQLDDEIVRKRPSLLIHRVLLYTVPIISVSSLIIASIWRLMGAKSLYFMVGWS